MSIVFEFKSIKPKRLKKVGIRQSILNALRTEGREVKAEYEKTTSTWNHRPTFEILIGLDRAEGASVLVGTDDPIFNFVDGGTKAHIIRPKRARRLRFQTGYRAKTRPGLIGSGGGGASGPIVYARFVHHPGTQARNFSSTIQKRRKDKFTRRVIEAMKAGAQTLF